jgi:hypothetical protein
MKRIPAIAALALLVAPAATMGKVYVDPGGPAGKEYGVPLDSTRGEAVDSEARGVPGQKQKPPLFGQGITPGGPDDPSGQTAGGSAAGDGADDSARSGDLGSPGGQRAAEPLDSPVSRLRDVDDGGGEDLPLAALIAAVLGVGGAVGFAMRRFAFPRQAR